MYKRYFCFILTTNIRTNVCIPFVALSIPLLQKYMIKENLQFNFHPVVNVKRKTGVVLLLACIDVPIVVIIARTTLKCN